MPFDVWVFHGAGGRFSSGVFTTRENAEAWIKQHQLTGVLTKYPIDVGVYDWAVENDFTNLRPCTRVTSELIQRFTTASQEHFHYEGGNLG